jgi:predicted nucleic acid-binding protein
MTDSIVVDASLALKWMIQEIDSDKAEALLQDTISSGQAIYAPPHFLGEVINALYQKVRTTDPAKHIEQADAEKAMADFLNLPIRIENPNTIYEQAFEFANIHSMFTIYDCLYVVLAQILGVELWTADRRLVTQLGSNAPWVRLISEYPLPEQPPPGSPPATESEIPRSDPL